MSDRVLSIAQELLATVSREVEVGAAMGEATEAVIGLIVGARIIDADLTRTVVEMMAKKGGGPVQTVELEAHLQTVELQVRRATVGWSKP